MKTLNFKSILTIGLMVAALLTGAQNAFAGPTVPVMALNIKGLNNFVGQNLTVYYAVGKKASLMTEGGQIKIDEVKAKVTYRINSGDVLVPRIDIPIFGVSSYNLIIFVVHAQGTFRWLNVDGNLPQNEIAAGSTTATEIKSVQKSEIDAASRSATVQNGQQVLDIKLF